MYGTYQRFGLTIWASDRAVIRAAWQRMQKRLRARRYRKLRHVFYREMLKYHHGDQRLAMEFRL